MTSTLYNLHTDGDQYRITKFVDGNPESSYLTTHSECQCPAGHRHTCRHRQMLPEMLAAGLENSHFFWDFDRHMAFDISGNAKHLLDALAATKLAPTLVDEDEVEIIDPDAIMGNGLPHLAGVYAKDITPAAPEGLHGAEGNDQDTIGSAGWADPLAPNDLLNDLPMKPHSQEVKAGDFDSPIGGSNPPAVATPAKPWRRI